MAAKATTPTDAALRTERDVAPSPPGTDDPLTTAAERLARDLDAMTRLHRLSTRFVRAGDLPQVVLEEIVDVAISITRADMGNIQLLDPASRRLRVAAYRGHEKWWLDFFESVAEGKGASCGAALQQGARAIVEDVTTSPVFVGTPALEVQLRAGIRAVQSTPLYGSSGDLVGMISTHFRTPHRPDERDLRLVDLLARQAADMIERVRSEAALRESEARFRLLVQGVKDYAIYMLAPDGTVRSWSAAAEQIFGYREDEIVGRHRRVFFTPEARAAGKAELDIEAALLEGRHHEEGWRVRKDGSRFFADVLLTALRNDAGQLRGFANVTRDVTERMRSEAALRQSEGKYVAIHDKAPFGIALMKLPELTFVTANDAFLRMIGFTREEVIGRTGPELGISDPDSQIQALREFEQRGSLRDFELIRRTKSGSGIVLSTSMERVTIDGTEFILATGQDVTARRKAEGALRAKEAELELILDRTPFMLTRCSRDLRYRYVSAAYARMLGRTPDQIAGRPIVEIMGEEGLATIRPHVDAVLRGEPVEYEDEVHFAGVGFRRLQVIYVPDRDERGEVVGWIANIVDVTESRQAEALRAANAQLVEADRRRTEFLGMLSHELRNPLAPIRNSLYLLDRSEPTGQEAHRAREVINRQVGHLTRLVDDLLDVTRITRGKVELRRVGIDLSALVRRTADDYRRMMQDRGLELAVEAGAGAIVVDGDETRLAQVFGNLLSNAAKFTPAGGRVTIAVGAEDGNAVVRVRDTGPGIASDVLPSIFEPFTQAKQTLARTEGGLGLGLALVRGLVSLHGGKVEAASGNGSGAEFIVTLPLAWTQDSRVAAPAVTAKAAAPVAHRRVLVVDDNEDAADTLAEMVRTLGHDAEVAYDGAAAVRRAGEYHPDVVLCDIGLPVMDGYAVAHELRAAHGRDIRLVAISGYAQPDDVTRAAEAGFDEHVAKPCGPERIERLLS